MSDEFLVKRANREFNLGNYHKALYLYQQASLAYGNKCFEYNVALCDRKNTKIKESDKLGALVSLTRGRPDEELVERINSLERELEGMRMEEAARFQEIVVLTELLESMDGKV